MRIVLGAVGRLKEDAERTLFQRYWQRLEAGGRAVGLTSFKLVEIAESREASAVQRKDGEATRLLAAAGTDAVLICLDERGKALTTLAFTDFLRGARDEGVRTLGFLIGGPDGHGPSIAASARLNLSLSALTLPHGLARVLLAEQLYRAATILAGHPYHRT